jgi:hypothetical protein
MPWPSSDLHPRAQRRDEPLLRAEALPRSRGAASREEALQDSIQVAPHQAGGRERVGAKRVDIGDHVPTRVVQCVGQVCNATKDRGRNMRNKHGTSTTVRRQAK